MNSKLNDRRQQKGKKVALKSILDQLIEAAFYAEGEEVDLLAEALELALEQFTADAASLLKE